VLSAGLAVCAWISCGRFACLHVDVGLIVDFFGGPAKRVLKGGILSVVVEMGCSGPQNGEPSGSFCGESRRPASLLQSSSSERVAPLLVRLVWLSLGPVGVAVPRAVEPGSCPSGENGGDAVIDIDDNDPEDDYSIRGVRHPEVDYLELGGPAPMFHVWTGPLYRFDSDGVASLSKAAPCNRWYRVDMSTDEAFSQAATLDSGWVEVGGDSAAGSSPGCFGAWTPSAEKWQKLQTGGAGSRVYYRVMTQDLSGSNPRISAEPGNGLWSVPAPYAVLTGNGMARY